VARDDERRRRCHRRGVPRPERRLRPLHDHKFDPILQKDYFALKHSFDGIMPSETFPMPQQLSERSMTGSWRLGAEDVGHSQQIAAIEDPVRRRTGLCDVEFRLTFKSC